jgi:hypothetical protein
MKEGDAMAVFKRTIYVSQCECGEKDVKVSNPPRERQCKCGRWNSYTEESFTGPSTFDGTHERRRVGDHRENERNVGVRDKIG